MKKTYLILSIISILSFTQSIFAQNNLKSFSRLSQAIFENLMFSNRVVRDYVFIISNNFKEKSIKDMDNTLGRFDYNMDIISGYLPDDKKLKDRFTKFRFYVNQSRLELMDFENPNYESFIRNLQQTFDENKVMADKIFEKQLGYKENKKVVEKLKLLSEVVNATERMVIDYMLIKDPKRTSKAKLEFDVKKQLKKLNSLLKIKNLSPQSKALLIDMKENLKLMNELVEKPDYRPKMMFAYVNNFSSKAFRLLPDLISLYKK